MCILVTLTRSERVVNLYEKILFHYNAHDITNLSLEKDLD